MKSFRKLAIHILAGTLSTLTLDINKILQAQSPTLTFIHTNDLQSRLLGFGPNREFTPHTTNDDHTIGGIARLATVIKAHKGKSPENTLVIDGGDFMMGTLFHTISREEGAELRLMAEIGYDAATLGNHEFDFRPVGLAQTLRSALAKGKIPTLLLANAVFSETDARDDSLAELFQQGVVKEYEIFERSGLKIGVFGLMGKDAAEVSPFAAPMQFADPIQAARRVVRTLKEDERVDVIICASHGGVWRNSEHEAWQGEDVELAAAVPEIDVIVGGHSHTLVSAPIVVNRTLVLQAGSEGRYVGVLSLQKDDQRLTMTNYEIIKVDDTIAGDPEIQANVERFKAIVDQNFLARHGYTFDQVLAETPFDLTLREEDSNLGNLATDAIRWGIDRHEYDPMRPQTKTALAVESNGVIRDEILTGQSGMLQVSDLFRVVPLGIGMMEDSPGYPLVSFYLTAAEIKRACEVLTSIYPKKGSSYYLQISGARVRYNPSRVPFDRVFEIDLENGDGAYEPLDLSSGNHRLYKIGCNIYVATFIKVIGSFTYGILNIAPRDSTGKPIENLEHALVDADPTTPGTQEVKQWEAFLSYVKQFKDTDSDNVPNLPERYRQPQGRIIALASWNPTLVYRNATSVTWGATAAATLVLLGALWLAKIVVTAIRKK